MLAGKLRSIADVLEWCLQTGGTCETYSSRCLVAQRQERSWFESKVRCQVGFRANVVRWIAGVKHRRARRKDPLIKLSSGQEAGRRQV